MTFLHNIYFLQIYLIPFDNLHSRYIGFGTPHDVTRDTDGIAARVMDEIIVT